MPLILLFLFGSRKSASELSDKTVSVAEEPLFSVLFGVSSLSLRESEDLSVSETASDAADSAGFEFSPTDMPLSGLGAVTGSVSVSAVADGFSSGRVGISGSVSETAVVVWFSSGWAEISFSVSETVVV